MWWVGMKYGRGWESEFNLFFFKMIVCEKNEIQ